MTATLAATAAALEPQRIFNHDIMGCTADGVVGNHLYSGRALGMTEPGDIIQLHPDLEPQWPYISNHYRRVGLTHTKDVLWHVRHRGLAEHPHDEISVFYFGAGEQEARSDNAWFRAVDFINSKNNFMALADELGVPVPKTLCFADVAAIPEADIRDFPYPCYLKAAVSVSGVGIYRCANEPELRAAMRRFEPGVPVQLQAEVVSKIFLNLQYEVDADGLHRLAATEQVLDGFAHQGNRYPASHEPWESIEPMAEWLYREGMRGVFAFDVAVVEQSGGVEYSAIECNPRFNGASYPTGIARKLGLRKWLARTFCTRHRSLADIDLMGIEYSAHKGEGVIMVNWGPVLVGKVLFLLAGSPPVQERLALELQRRL
ncbi:MAG: ATP-grasp domain-containing protein [Pseudomonadota bacterium]|nr:ATP-grasp domain-containing protein [Pseudomonadota bacterium]